MGQARPLGPRRTAPCSRRGRLLPQEARQVPRDRRVGGVGQAELLQARRAAAARGISVLATAGRKPSPSTRSMSSRSSVALIVPPTRPVPLPRIVTGCSLAFDAGSSSFSLATRQLCHSACMLAAVDARALLGQPLRHHAGQRQVDVVAAQQDVLAHRHAVRAPARRRAR